MKDKQVLGLIIFVNSQTILLLAAINDMNIGISLLAAMINVLGIIFLFIGAKAD